MRLVPRLLLSVALLCLAAAGPARAEGGPTVPPIDNPVVQKECGACHMAYAPQMLPMRSWQAIMANLGDHFGENATLAASDGTAIAAYLVAHAGDAPGTVNGRRFMRGIPVDATPLRITDTRFWKRGHSEISAASFAAPNVKSKANCVACHSAAAAGQYGEEE
jgi:cytochrome c551/c552